jgi:hypothetical protein
VIHREIAKQLRIDPMVKNAMAEAFAVVLDEFRDVTLQDSAVLESVGRQVHGVTGGQMQEFAQRLRDAAPRLLTEGQILAWADAHLESTTEWPNNSSGPVVDAPGEVWKNVDAALRQGLRGLPGGSSLPQLLAAHRGVRNQKKLPSLTVEQILAWAEAHHARTGHWPNRNSGPVADAPGETWHALASALVKGLRQLAGGSSLAQLLAERRGVRNKQDLPDVTERQILAWADSHYARFGEWPTRDLGAIDGSIGETWNNIDAALRSGIRRFPGGSSLAKLLAQHRGVRNRKNLPALSKEQILIWAEAHRARAGRWPNAESGPIEDAPGDV